MSVLYAMCVPHPPLIIPEIGQGEEKPLVTQYNLMNPL